MAEGLFYQDVYGLVKEVMGDMDRKAGEYGSKLDLAINQLSSAAGLPTIPTAPRYTDPGAIAPTPMTAVSRVVRPATTFTPFVMPAEPATDISAGEVDGIIASIPDFNPSIRGLTIPNAPSAIDTSGLPTKPTMTSLSLPSAPQLSFPEMQAMIDIDIPAFEMPLMPTFTEGPPTLDAVAPSEVMAWSEPVYQDEELDAVHLRVQDMMNGRSGLPAAVESALFERLRARDGDAALKLTQEAMETFASRGFTLPPGALSARIREVQEDNRLKASDSANQVYTKGQEVLIAQLNEGIKQALAKESLTMSLFHNIQQRRLEIEKFRLEQAVSIYNAKVQAYNISMQAYGVLATVFKTRTEAALSILQAYKIRLEGEALKGEINKNLVAVFVARLQAVNARVDVYKTSMEAAKVQADINDTMMKGFKTEIEAYAARIGADKMRFEAYQAQIDGEKGKAQIMESEARAFAARVSAISTAGELGIKKITAKVEVAKMHTDQFVAKVRAEGERSQASASYADAMARLYASDVQMFSAESNVNASRAELDLKRVEASLRNSISLYHVEVQQFTSLAQRIIDIAKMQRDGASAMGRYAAQLAAGALSAQHVSASVAGSGSGSESFTNANTTSTSHVYSHEGSPG